jgi:hypothetical protein
MPYGVSPSNNINRMKAGRNVVPPSRTRNKRTPPQLSCSHPDTTSIKRGLSCAEFFFGPVDDIAEVVCRSIGKDNRPTGIFHSFLGLDR